MNNFLNKPSFLFWCHWGTIKDAGDIMFSNCLIFLLLVIVYMYINVYKTVDVVDKETIEA